MSESQFADTQPLGQYFVQHQQVLSPSSSTNSTSIHRGHHKSHHTTTHNTNTNTNTNPNQGALPERNHTAPRRPSSAHEVASVFSPTNSATPTVFSRRRSHVFGSTRKLMAIAQNLPGGATPNEAVYVRANAARVEFLEQQNFDLKLRIFQLEQQLARHGLAEPPPSAILEVEEMQAQLLELQDLVQQRDSLLSKAHAHIETLERKIDSLMVANPRTHTPHGADNSTAKFELLEQVTQLQDKVCELERQRKDRDALLEESMKILTDLEAQCLDLEQQNNSLQVDIELERTSKAAELAEATNSAKQHQLCAQCRSSVAGSHTPSADLNKNLSKLKEHNRLLILELEEKRALVQFVQRECNKLKQDMASNKENTPNPARPTPIK